MKRSIEICIGNKVRVQGGEVVLEQASVIRGREDVFWVELIVDDRTRVSGPVNRESLNILLARDMDSPSPLAT